MRQLHTHQTIYPRNRNYSGPVWPTRFSGIDEEGLHIIKAGFNGISIAVIEYKLVFNDPNKTAIKEASAGQLERHSNYTEVIQ
mmetsp:Transcript_123573/g.245967  ORF Transcript_123573/g.245967 Transcript_123573/m.245967 type:complete len:83 (-) Transcript_123573:125-373(-)